MFIAIGITVLTLSSAGIIFYGELRGRWWAKDNAWQRGVLALIFILGFFGGMFAVGFTLNVTLFWIHIFTCIIALAVVAFAD